MMQGMRSSQNYNTLNCNMNSCHHRSTNCNSNSNSDCNPDFGYNSNSDGNSGCNSSSNCSSGCNSNSIRNNNRNPNCNCNMNQQTLKRYIDFVSFAALDCAMFLDTHPKNAEALEYFAYYQNARTQALKEYGSRFSPLTLDTIPKGTDFWAWTNTPWPWEMEG